MFDIDDWVWVDYYDADGDDDEGYGFHSQEEYGEWEREWHPERVPDEKARLNFHGQDR